MGIEREEVKKNKNSNFLLFSQNCRFSINTQNLAASKQSITGKVGTNQGGEREKERVSTENAAMLGGGGHEIQQEKKKVKLCFIFLLLSIIIRLSTPRKRKRRRKSTFRFFFSLTLAFRRS